MNYYVIPTKVDTLSTNIIKIHIAEGPFDILSIFTNLCNCNMESNIYISSGGKSYRQALEFVLEQTGIVNYEIHMYIDNDVSDDEFYRLFMYKSQYLPANIYIHRNTMKGQKDYGVPLNQICDSVRVIKYYY